MSKTIMFARLNIQLAPKKDIEKIAAEIEDILYDAAIEAFADDAESFYDEKLRVVGVSIPFQGNIMLILEAGSVLGRCQMAFEQMNNAPRSETIWFSVHEPDETTIDTRHSPV
ncbi:hypothetical protein MCEMSE6_02134 [Oxalobacteraceae bacterium]|jgi:hypothetical protein|nr:hypothetical protein [Polynucleobacter sp.]MCF8188437.1 hypothetical protein [Sulfuritalea sp.]